MLDIDDLKGKIVKFNYYEAMRIDITAVSLSENQNAYLHSANRYVNEASDHGPIQLAVDFASLGRCSS